MPSKWTAPNAGPVAERNVEGVVPGPLRSSMTDISARPAHSTLRTGAAHFRVQSRGRMFEIAIPRRPPPAVAFAPLGHEAERGTAFESARQVPPPMAIKGGEVLRRISGEWI